MAQHDTLPYVYGIAISETTIARWLPQAIERVKARIEDSQKESGLGDSLLDDEELDHLVDTYTDLALELSNQKKLKGDDARRDKEIHDEMNADATRESGA